MTAPYQGHTYRVGAVAYSPDGATLATAGDDGTARIWAADTGEQLRTLTGHTDRVWAVSYSPDGATLATAGTDGTARIWAADTGEQLRTLTGHTNWVRAVAYSPDGATLATAGADATIRIWNPRTGRQVAGTSFGVSSWRVGTLAQIRNDAPTSDDLLGFAADARTLAELVTALATEPPLAIALIGDWGSGKSSLLRQVQDRVQELADLSLSNLGLSSFAANVRQVRFNAWHYSDAHLWTGLVDHLFRELATARDEPPPPHLSEASVAAERTKRAATVEGLRTQDAQLTAGLSRFQTGGKRDLWYGLRSPAEYAALLVTAVRALALDSRTWIWLAVWWAVVASVALGAWQWLGQDVARAIAAAGALLSFLAVVADRLRAWRHAGGRLAERLRTRLEQRRQEIRERLEMESMRLAEVDAAYRLSRFLQSSTTTEDYAGYRGLLDQVYRDLEELDRDLRAARRQWEAIPTPTPPLQRIMLYIDDLDRCPPQRVVEVLAAVHLMLALPLFVVFVAVDPRWLVSSLEHHYAELFNRSDARDDNSAEVDLATPLDYLDKIFQIPFAVAPLTADAAARYITRLVTPEPSPPRQGRATTGPSDTRRRDATASASEHIPEAPAANDGMDPAAATGTYVAQPSTARASPPPRAEQLRTHGLRLDRGDHPPSRNVAPPDLRAPGLKLTPAETASLPKIAPLLPTPRAVKKLVNLYRLIRISIDPTDLPTFLNTRAYPPVLALLAVVIGHPSHAQAILRAILSATEDDIQTLLTAPAAADVPPFEWEAAHPTRTQLAHVVKTLDEPGTEQQHPIDAYRESCRTVARFSFHTRRLMN